MLLFKQMMIVYLFYQENKLNKLKINKLQKSAFPPNFVHSLDSTHMMMTAIEMERLNIPFTAVHDSYWTYPCHVDEMNKVFYNNNNNY